MKVWRNLRGGRGGMLTTVEWCNPVCNIHVAPCVKGVECGLVTRGLRIVAAS